MKLVLAILAACLLAPCALARAQSPQLAVEDLECRGNTHTSCAYILRYVDLRVGGVVQEAAIEDARYRLAALPNFSSVDIYLTRGENKGRARVVVEVAERDPLAMELVAGTSYYLSSVSQRLAARVSHQNLFATGKILEALVDARVPLRDPSRKSFRARAQYVDPQLLAAPRYYLIAGISTVDDRIAERDGSLFVFEGSGVDIAVGRRIWDFSHVALGYRYSWDVVSNSYSCNRRTDCEFHDLSREHVAAITYGWNSEDDPYFPTQGSRLTMNLQLEAGSNESRTTGGFGFRKTWRTGGSSLLMLNAGATPGTEYRSSFEENLAFAITYARPIAAHDGFGIRRGRWYIQAGWDRLSAYSDPTWVSMRAGLKAGVRLDTKSFGIVDLYVMAVGEGTLWED